MILRTATSADAGWIDEQYAVAGFLSSDLARDVLVIAELDGRRAGMGRLVPAGEGAFELGGMWVLEAFRGRGIARAIVDELIASDRLPGSHLVPTVRGELLARLGRRPEARAELELAARLCANQRERSVLLRKAAALG